MLQVVESFGLIALGAAALVLTVVMPVLTVRRMIRSGHQYSRNSLQSWSLMMMALTAIYIGIIAAGCSLFPRGQESAGGGAEKEWQPTPTVSMADMFR